MRLRDQIKDPAMWPTPLATDGGHGGPNQRGGKGDLRLSSAVHQFPTPTASMVTMADMEQARFAGNGGKRPSYQTAKHWPTPRAANPGSRPNGKGGKILAEEVAIAEGMRERGQTFATPKSRDWKGQSQRGIHAPGDALPNMDRGDGKPVGGSLNPTWVEWLMGWPLGWTDCAASATDRFQQWLNSHGQF
jgi:hypothetical protein